MDEASPVLNRVSMAIGETCVWWSFIEQMAGELIFALASCFSLEFLEAAPMTVLDMAVSNMDIRTKVATGKAMAGLLPYELGIYAPIEAALNRVDNELRSERNRYVHDAWSANGGEIRRIKAGTIVKRPQSRAIELNTRTEKLFGGIEEVEAFVTKLQLSYDELKHLRDKALELSSLRKARFQEPQ